MGRRLMLALALCAALALSACSLPQSLTASDSPAPDLRLLDWPAYEIASAPAQEEETDAQLVDLWLDASQLMGGINTTGGTLYPHSSRKYREGGFHYRFGSQVGMYEGVLRCLLSAAEGSRVRVLRVGNERLGEDSLSLLAGTDAQTLRSVTRDLLTYAIDPMPSVFSGMSAEDMDGSFYSLGTPMLNQLRALDAGALENPSLAARMADLLDAQIAAIAGRDTEGYVASGDDDAPLLYALGNIDLSRLSVITCDPATLRRLSSVEVDGTAVDHVTALLKSRGVFEAGLCVELYAFTLDYMGQMSSFAAADFAEPLIWGRLNYDNDTQRADAALPMPRTLLMLVIGTPGQVDRYTRRLNASLESSPALQGVRGPEDGELTYASGGQTVTQQPFSFAWSSVRIQRPQWVCATQASDGASLSASADVSESGGLPSVVLPAEGKSTLTVSVPVSGTADADLTALSGYAGVEAALLLDHTLPTTEQAEEGQVIALRDTQYVFTRQDEAFRSGEKASPFTLASVAAQGDGSSLRLTVDAASLTPGCYRVLLSVDLPGTQVVWEEVPWVRALDARPSNEDVSAWEQFTQAVRQYDGDRSSIPRWLQHAWGPEAGGDYHGLEIPDAPPVMRAPWLGELISQCRAAAAGDAFPLVRYVLDVFVSAGTPEGGG